MAIGFGLAVAFRISVGIDDGPQPRCGIVFNPLLMVTYPVPKAALMPIIMLWLGVGDVAKMLVIFLGVSLPVIYHSFQGAKAVEEKMLWVGGCDGPVGGAAHDPDRAPGGAAGNPDRLRTGLVLALITMVTSEMIARQSGAGNILFNALAWDSNEHRLRHDHHHRRDGYRLDAPSKKIRQQAGKMVRAGLRYSIELCMNARA